jgi:biopolymer transport protein ExbD
VAKHSVINDGLVDSGEPITAINVTSLVDVMFCLLIMFMVATPLLAQESAEVELPAARGESITEEEFLYTVISVDSKGQVFLGTLPLSQDPAKMREELANNAKIKEDGRASLQADQNVDFERVVDVLAAMKEAEVGEIGFVTDPNIRRIEEMKKQP